MTANAPRNNTIQQLARQLRQIKQSRQQPADGSHSTPTGIEPLDRLLPEGGFYRGTIAEWLTDGEGTGAGTLALMAARPALETGGALVVIDLKREFYPPAAVQLGIDLNKTIVVRPHKPQDALWALEQSLRSRGVAVSFCWLEHLHHRAFRRLQLAAEAGGGIGLLIRPSTARRQPSWAEIRLLVGPLPWTNSPSHLVAGSTFVSGRRLRIELLHCRGGISGRTIELEISDETGDVHLVPQLVPAASWKQA